MYNMIILIVKRLKTQEHAEENRKQYGGASKTGD